MTPTDAATQEVSQEVPQAMAREHVAEDEGVQRALREAAGGPAREAALRCGEIVRPERPRGRPRAVVGGREAEELMERLAAEVARLSATRPCPLAPPVRVAETEGLPASSPSWSPSVLAAGRTASHARPLPTELREGGVVPAHSLEEAALMALSLSAERSRRADALRVRVTRGGPRASGARVRAVMGADPVASLCRRPLP